MRKDTYDFEAKQEYHKQLRKYIEKQFPNEKRRRNLRVACLPGHEGLEIQRVYKPLGIRADRIWGIEQEATTYQDIEGLGTGINLYQGSALSFFDRPGEAFDIVNLDFQSQLKDEEAITISTLFQRGRASPRCILGTNFYGSRESEERKDHYQRSITYFSSGGSARGFLEESELNGDLKRWIDARVDFNTFKDKRDDLDDVRDKMIGLELRYLTSANTSFESLESLNKLTLGGWIRELISQTGYPSSFEEMQKDPIKHNGFILSIDGLLRSGLMELLSNEFQRENDGLRNSLYLFTEISSLKRPRFITEFHKGRYVSDNGSPMFFDFLTVQSRPELFKDIRVQIDLAQNYPCRVIFHEGSETRNIAQGVNVVRLGNSVAAILGMNRLQESRSLEEALESRGVFLVGDKSRFERRIGEFSEMILQENAYVNADRETIQIKSFGERVREDLIAQKPEGEILRQYELTTQELAGHKAALTRQTGISQSASTLYQPTEAEETQILEFLSQGCVDDQQIMLSYNLTKMQLAARKALLTRKRNAANLEVTA